METNQSCAWVLAGFGLGVSLSKDFMLRLSHTYVISKSM